MRRIRSTTVPWSTRAAVLLGALASLLAMLGSWIPSLWGDEVASLLSAERSVPSLLGMATHVDAVHATYYLGLHFWVKLAGTSPFAVRLPSALAVGACVGGVVVLAESIGSRRLAIVAGVICAALPRLSYDGEEARSYAFSAALATWATILFLRGLRDGRRRWWAAYCVVAILSILVFLYLALVILSHGLVFVVDRGSRPRLRRWLAGVLVAAVAVSPLLLFAFLERGQISYLSSEQQVTFNSVVVSMWFGNLFAAILGWPLLVAGGVVVALRLRRRVGPPRMPGQAVLLAWWLLPTVLLIGTSPVVAGFTARYLAICAPAVGLLVAVALDAALGRRRVLLAVATAVVVGLAVPSWLAQRGPYSKNNSDLVQIGEQVQRLAAPGDGIVFDESVGPSHRPRLALRAYPQYFRAVEDVTLAIPFWRNTTWHDTALTVDAASAAGRFRGVTRVWVVEYRLGSCVDDDGVASLEGLGYRPTTVRRTHRSEIIGFTLGAATPTALPDLRSRCI